MHWFDRRYVGLMEGKEVVCHSCVRFSLLGNMEVSKGLRD